MKETPGTSRICLALKSFSDKVGGIVSSFSSPSKYKRLDPKLEKKIMEAIKKRASSGQNSFRSINTIIMKFPHFKEGLRNMKAVFEQYDEDSNGIIERNELNKCLENLQVHLSEEETEGIFESFYVDGKGVKPNDFVVLLCLIYLLMDPSDYSKSTVVSQHEATFNAIVEAFLFFDKNGDGKLNRRELVRALNDAFPWEKSPGHITKSRFKEMDWTNSGKVNFKEFVFTLIDWVGIDGDEDQDHLRKR